MTLGMGKEEFVLGGWGNRIRHWHCFSNIMTFKRTCSAELLIFLFALHSVTRICFVEQCLHSKLFSFKQSLRFLEKRCSDVNSSGRMFEIWYVSNSRGVHVSFKAASPLPLWKNLSVDPLRFKHREHRYNKNWFHIISWHVCLLDLCFHHCCS